MLTQCDYAKTQWMIKEATDAVLPYAIQLARVKAADFFSLIS